MSLLQASSISAETHGVQLISDVSLNLNAGEVITIVGPNGAGKTSLARALTGELPLSHGEILLNDKPLRQHQRQDRARQLAVLAQQTSLNFPFLVSDVVHLGRIPHQSGRQIDFEVVTQVLTAMDMVARADNIYTWLSGGEKQRVQLARVMAQIWRAVDSSSRVLILDEPTASLDVAHTGQLMRMVKQLAEGGVGVIMILHDFNLAARYADRILVLKNSRLEAEGEPGTVLTESNMRRLFDVECRIIPHPDSGRPMVFIND